MQGRWAVILAGMAIVSSVATDALSASPTGRAVETETIIVPTDDPKDGDPGLAIPDASEVENDASEEDAAEADPSGVLPSAGPPPTVEYDLSKLPAPVRRLREQIIEAATTGDVEQLRPIFEANSEPPLLGFGGGMGDPIDELKALAGDPEGREVLAILIEVLEAGYVHVDVGTPEEMYIWPYFARYPIEELSGPQMVELFKLLTAGDYEDMKIYGTYLFYRAGIDPKGGWRYFLAGD